jgi:hypothetical protein
MWPNAMPAWLASNYRACEAGNPARSQPPAVRKEQKPPGKAAAATIGCPTGGAKRMCFILHFGKTFSPLGNLT